MDYISNLPVEVLVEIFKYCSLKKLKLVSRKFNDVIVGSRQLMNRLTFGAYRIIMESTTVEIEDIRLIKIDHGFIERFSAFHNVSSLSFDSSFVLPEKLFVLMMNRLSCLKTMSFETVRLRSAESVELAVPQMLKLKTLSFDDSDDKILTFLKRACLESLTLGRSHNLNHTEHLIGFLKSQKNIKDIRLCGSNYVDDEILSIIFREMKNLKKFFLGCNYFNMRNPMGVTNSTITTLSLSIWSAETVPRIVLNIFKSVKNLALANTKANLIEPFAASLESLTIWRGYYTHELCSLQIPNLKYLKVFASLQSDISSEGWEMLLASRNPMMNTIETLIIQDHTITNSMFASICSEFRNLHHFEVFYKPDRLTSDILNWICDPNFPRNIRFLKITQKARSDSNFLALTENQKTALHAKTWLKCIVN